MLIDAKKSTQREQWQRLLAGGAAAILLYVTLLNMSRFQHSLGDIKEFASGRAMSEQKRTQVSIPFNMCNRETPFQYDINPLLRPAEQRPIIKFKIDWPTKNKILLLRNDGQFGRFGNQMNSLLHAYDYARDNELELGMLFHSWAMDTIQTMYYETDDFDALGQEILEELGIKVIRNQTQLEGYDEVISENSQRLYFYRSTHHGLDNWRDAMDIHIAILQRLFLRYNRGYGYIHSGLRAQDICSSLDMFFHERARDVKYTVIHSRWLDGNAEWRLEEIAKTTGLTIEGGALYMGPAYVKAILKPLGMLEYPIILLCDGQLSSVERGLFNDPVIGPKLMVLSEKDALAEAEMALAILSDVFIGNPASVTSGFIARSRKALGYSDKSTQLFRRKRLHQWYSVCNGECAFNPWILGKWV
ncbi:hypothetical protein ACHAXR_003177 [Thalassiosira sp. AJA248-18]